VKNLRSRIKRLPLMTPSPDLDERVLRQKPERPVPTYPVPRRVPLWGTAVVGLSMVVLGFVAGAAWRGGQSATSQDSPSGVVVHVIHHAAPWGNPFDFSRPVHFFPAKDVEVTTRKLDTKI
jgi:hypothetical protein